MVDDRQLSSVLSEFAFTLATDFSITSILDHLVRQIVDIVPVTSAGVTLIGPDHEPRHVAASDDDALRFERLQTDLEEGPCVAAYVSGEAVSIPDMALDDRFTLFAPAALDAGLRAVFTFPLNHGRRRLGALDLYRDTEGGLDPHAMEAAQTLADVAAAYLLNAWARDEAHLSSDQMRHLATHDELTGLPNRMLLLERIDHAAQRARRSHAPAAVLFIDLDRFKRVNDTYGHEAGDELLKGVAQRLAATVRPGDTLARVYGDEFVLLCEELHQEHDIDSVAERIRLVFDTPFSLDDADVLVSASVGVAYAGPGDQISGALIDEADRAMYETKRSTASAANAGSVLTGNGAPSRARSIALGRDLRAALTGAGGLDVAYQPIVRSTDGAVAAVEALLRWTHPVEGLIPALAAIAVAERSGAIVDVGAWVLDRGCRDWVRWHREHPEVSLDLTVNASTVQLLAPHFVEELGATLQRTGMPAERLVLDVTEGVLIDYPERARLILGDLRSHGVRIALDDFGTGHSSFGYLNQLPLDIVKIDRESVASSRSADTSGAVIAAMTRLAHALGLTVVIEGVETGSQRTAAEEVGADLAQGYFFGPPVAAHDIDEMLRTASASTRPLKLPLQRASDDHSRVSR
jgi:diguanylate cyclase (GGDEF)-like protein